MAQYINNSVTSLQLITLNILLGIFCGIVGYHYIGRIRYRGPDSNIVRNEIYKIGNECYMFIPIKCLCANETNSNTTSNPTFEKCS